ncbi:hypothetical protein Scep_021461 [Stephania cephalantha]|uniref:Uncharacterized protein n=1 Tax=Stephania cephalantha TaxID=152367 RepID=A0AAP0F665_9MAGN
MAGAAPAAEQPRMRAAADKEYYPALRGEGERSGERGETEEGGRRRGGQTVLTGESGRVCARRRRLSSLAGVRGGTWNVVFCGGPVVRQSSGDGQWRRRRDLRRRRGRKEQRRRRRKEGSVAAEWR